MPHRWTLDPDRVFGHDARRRDLARELFEEVRALPLHAVLSRIDPPSLDAAGGGEGASSIAPAATILSAEPGLARLLRSLGRPSVESAWTGEEGDRATWRAFWAEAPALQGTPAWWRLEHILIDVLGMDGLPEERTVDEAYDRLKDRLALPDLHPRFLAAQAGIAAIGLRLPITEDLARVRTWQDQGIPLRPVLCPGPVIDPAQEGWIKAVAVLGERSGVAVDDYAGYLRAIQARREAFARLGAVCVDHARPGASGDPVDDAVAASLYQRLLEGSASSDDARRFAAHMLLEMARMSAEDSLVMMLGAGSPRDQAVAPPPTATLHQSLRPLLDDLGRHPGFRLVVYGADEGADAVQLAHWAADVPALRLGAPWRAGDGPSAIARYLDLTMEVASLGNLAGFLDQAPSLLSITGRHELWRRSVCDWLADRTLRGLIDRTQALAWAADLSSRQVRRTFPPS